MRSYNTDQHQ